MSTLAPGAITTPHLLARLERHYIKPGDALPGGMFLPEVTHTGYGGRRVDALYVGFTSSRGHHLVGHELKVSRADWLHELKSIDKAETWASQCHAWYLVTGSPSIARPEELPHGWGLMTIDPSTKTRLRILERALVRPDVVPDWVTMHSVLKRVDTLRAHAVLDARAKADEAVQHDMAKLREQAARVTLDPAGGSRLERAEALVAELAQILGVTDIGGPRSWADGALTIDELRNAFPRYLLASRDADRALAGRARGLEHAQQALKQALAALDEAQVFLRPPAAAQ